MQGVWVDSHVSQGPKVLLSRQDDKDKETQKERQQVDVLGEDGIGVQDLCQDEVEVREEERRGVCRFVNYSSTVTGGTRTPSQIMCCTC